MPLLALAQCREAVGDREAMMRCYERAVSLAPDSPAVLFALGSACLRMDALEAAEECLTAAVERDGSRADYRLNHALCLIKRGETARAQEALEAIVRRWPQLQQARELSALIARLPGAGPVGGRR
jgi:tetratricopeptide (TPR) repeat protein